MIITKSSVVVNQNYIKKYWIIVVCSNEYLCPNYKAFSILTFKEV